MANMPAKLQLGINFRATIILGNAVRSLLDSKHMFCLRSQQSRNRCHGDDLIFVNTCQQRGQEIFSFTPWVNFIFKMAMCHLSKKKGTIQTSM